MGLRFRQAIWSLAAVAAGGYAVVHLTGTQGLPAMLQKRKQIQVLEEETRRLEQENQKLASYLDDLKSSPDRQRQLVRERLHYVEPGSVDFSAPGESSERPVKPKR
jgi:cell division protein FtsB